MISPRVTLLVLLLALGLSYTDLTLLNCPAQFNVTQYNITADTTTTTLGKFLYSSFQTASSKNRVRSIVVSGDTASLSSYAN